ATLAGFRLDIHACCPVHAQETAWRKRSSLSLWERARVREKHATHWRPTTPSRRPSPASGRGRKRAIPQRYPAFSLGGVKAKQVLQCLPACALKGAGAQQAVEKPRSPFDTSGRPCVTAQEAGNHIGLPLHRKGNTKKNLGGTYADTRYAHSQQPGPWRGRAGRHRCADGGSRRV